MTKSFTLINSKLNYVLIAIWVVINLIQAATLELAHDEAYYWMYAKFLDLGYFDHPPMIAVLIKSGYMIFANELGVRLFMILLNLGTVLILHQLTNKKHFLLILGIICSMSIFHVCGFIAVPDTPLLAFSALFFYAYKLFLSKPSAIHILFISITIGLLLYSKYHGILILFFTVLSNLSLFKRKEFYLVIFLSLIVYFPHIYWQITNDYPSYKYHVLNKSQVAYNPIDTILYVLGQLLIYGPLIGWFLFYAAFKFKPTTRLEKAFQYNLFGVLAFFLISTLNARVEPNWTICIFVPLVVLSHQWFLAHKRFLKPLRYIALVSISLILLIRGALIFDLIPDSIKITSELHGWKDWAQTIQKSAENKPVVFMNSYQKASKYAFYTGQKSLSLNNIHYRRNQYDLWNIEDNLQGESIVLLPNWEIPEFDSIITTKESYNYVVIDNFRSNNKIWIESSIANNAEHLSGQELLLNLSLLNNYSDSVKFDSNNQFPVNLVCTIFNKDEQVEERLLLPMKNQVLFDKLDYQFNFNIPKTAGIYYLRFSLKTGWLPPTINSNLIRLVVS